MAKRRRVSKASKRRLMCFGILSIAIIIYFFISLGTYVLKIANLSNEKKKLEQELVEMKESEEDLSNEIERLKDPDYLARYARENYSYSKDGEYIIKLDKDNNIEKVQETPEYKQYIIYIGAIIIGMVFIYIIRKGNKRKKIKQNKNKRNL